MVRQSPTKAERLSEPYGDELFGPPGNGKVSSKAKSKLKRNFDEISAAFEGFQPNDLDMFENTNTPDDDVFPELHFPDQEYDVKPEVVGVKRRKLDEKFQENADNVLMNQIDNITSLGVGQLRRCIAVLMKVRGDPNGLPSEGLSSKTPRFGSNTGVTPRFSDNDVDDANTEMNVGIDVSNLTAVGSVFGCTMINVKNHNGLDNENAATKNTHKTQSLSDLKGSLNKAAIELERSVKSNDLTLTKLVRILDRHPADYSIQDATFLHHLKTAVEKTLDVVSTHSTKFLTEELENSMSVRDNEDELNNAIILSSNVSLGGSTSVNGSHENSLEKPTGSSGSHSIGSTGTGDVKGSDASLMLVGNSTVLNTASAVNLDSVQLNNIAVPNFQSQATGDNEEIEREVLTLLELKHTLEQARSELRRQQKDYLAAENRLRSVQESKLEHEEFLQRPPNKKSYAITFHEDQGGVLTQFDKMVNEFEMWEMVYQGLEEVAKGVEEVAKGVADTEPDTEDLLKSAFLELRDEVRQLEKVRAKKGLTPVICETLWKFSEKAISSSSDVSMNANKGAVPSESNTNISGNSNDINEKEYYCMSLKMILFKIQIRLFRMEENAFMKFEFSLDQAKRQFMEYNLSLKQHEDYCKEFEPTCEESVQEVAFKYNQQREKVITLKRQLVEGKPKGGDSIVNLGCVGDAHVTQLSDARRKLVARIYRDNLGIQEEIDCDYILKKGLQTLTTLVKKSIVYRTMFEKNDV